MEENKLVLPAIAVRGIVPLPNNEFRIEVGRENSVLALDAAEKMYGGNVLLLIQKDANIVDVKPSDIEKIGVLAKITLKLKLPNKNYKVKFKITDRIDVLEFTSLEPYFVCAYDKLHSVLTGDDLETALIKKVSAAITNAGIKNNKSALYSFRFIRSSLTSRLKNKSTTLSPFSSDFLAFLTLVLKSWISIVIDNLYSFMSTIASRCFFIASFAFFFFS